MSKWKVVKVETASGHGTCRIDANWTIERCAGENCGRHVYTGDYEHSFQELLADAQAECDKRNAKAAEVKAPDGYEFSDTMGVTDVGGFALAWSAELGFDIRRVGVTDVHWLPGKVRWLIPAAPKKETRAEAMIRARLYFGEHIAGGTLHGAFMAGAGFE